MSKINEDKDAAARILFDAASRASHQFDKTTRRDALARIAAAVEQGQDPKTAAYSVAAFFLLGPQWDEDGKLTVSP